MSKAEIKINLNYFIKVKLTDLGKDIYYHRFDKLNDYCGREVLKPRFPKVDENGYTKFQLWEFIELYGEHIGMGRPSIIDPFEIIYEESPTKRKKGKWINAYPKIETNPMFMYGICSECGFEQSLSGKLNFCPNCGAKMEGEE